MKEYAVMMMDNNETMHFEGSKPTFEAAQARWRELFREKISAFLEENKEDADIRQLVLETLDSLLAADTEHVEDEVVQYGIVCEPQKAKGYFGLLFEGELQAVVFYLQVVKINIREGENGDGNV